MKETIYLRVSPSRVEGMTKRLPDLQRGEIPVKLVIEVDAGAFREPVIERHVKITDWREGIDIADLDLRESVITEAEAQMIRDRRLAQMRQILEDHGFEVTPATETGDPVA
jgi:hypothetical protein